MAWQNAFDIGACELQIIDFGSNEIIAPAAYAGLGLAISETDGVVTFVQPDGTDGLYIALVRMQYDTELCAARVVGTTAETGVLFSVTEVRAPYFNDEFNDVNALYDSVDPFSPEPLNVLAAGDAEFDGVGILPSEAGGA